MEGQTKVSEGIQDPNRINHTSDNQTTEDATSDTAPQPNVGDAAGAVEEEQAPPEPPIPAQTVQPPVPARKRAKLQWPYGSGAPGFGRYYGKKWYNSDSEEQDEHDDPPLPATTSNTRSFPVPKYRK